MKQKTNGGEWTYRFSFLFFFLVPAGPSCVCGYCGFVWCGGAFELIKFGACASDSIRKPRPTARWFLVVRRESISSGLGNLLPPLLFHQLSLLYLALTSFFLLLSSLLLSVVFVFVLLCCYCLWCSLLSVFFLANSAWLREIEGLLYNLFLVTSPSLLSEKLTVESTIVLVTNSAP